MVAAVICCGFDPRTFLSLETEEDQELCCYCTSGKSWRQVSDPWHQIEIHNFSLKPVWRRGVLTFLIVKPQDGKWRLWYAGPVAVVSQLHFGQMWSHFLVSVQTSLLERIAFRDPVVWAKQPRLVHSESAAKVPGDVENLKILQVSSPVS